MTDSSETVRHFASDNSAGVHPEVMDALLEANRGHAMAYGADRWTEKAQSLFGQHFGEHARSYLVASGTAANVISLASVVRPYNAIICSDQAHLLHDECGAPEWHLGCKVLPAATVEGKLTTQSISPLLGTPRGDHSAKPCVVTISQCTEVGTVYTQSELRELADFCHAHELYLHVDGARICNAAAALGVSLAQITTDVGVDLLSFGGTKNGLMAAEAVIVLNPECDVELGRVRKQSMQLLSKMRFVAAQFVALLDGDLWLRSARHANAMAERLESRACEIDGVELAFPRQSNGVFAILPRDWIEPLQKFSAFHVWDDESGSVRWMTAFDTTPDDIDSFVAQLTALQAG